MTPDNVRRVIRASAAYDLILSAAFATPWTAAVALGAIGDLHRALGLDGVAPSWDDPFTMLFVNLMGSIVSVWSVLRLLRPTPFLGGGDAAARFLFSAWFAWALTGGASMVLVGFLVLELGWGLVQALAVWRPASLRALAGRHTLPA